MVAIILLNFNQNEYSIKCLESILKSSYTDFKILFIDNGSEEKNYENLNKYLPVDIRIKQYRLTKNIGYVGGCNFGLREADKLNAEYVLVMNNDTIIDENAIYELLKLCKNKKDKVVVTGKVYHYDEPNKLQDIGYIYRNSKALEYNKVGKDEIDVGQYDEVSERDMIDDVFWLFSLNLYKKIGGYSPYFWFNAEQADFALRATKEGYKLLYTPDAKIWHKGSVSIGGRDRNPRLAYWHIQSTLIFRYRNLSRSNFLNQYLKIIKSILGSYSKVYIERINGNNADYRYPYAKLRGFFYFNKWFFVRNENKGFNPFDN